MAACEGGGPVFSVDRIAGLSVATFLLIIAIPTAVIGSILFVLVTLTCVFVWLIVSRPRSILLLSDQIVIEYRSRRETNPVSAQLNVQYERGSLSDKNEYKFTFSFEKPYRVLKCSALGMANSSLEVVDVLRETFPNHFWSGAEELESEAEESSMA